MSEKLNPRDKLSRARVDLFKERPFYGNLLMYLRLKEDKEQLTLGVCPNGTLLYNPDYIGNKNKKEVTFSLIHELGHFITSTVGKARMAGRDKLVSAELPEDAQDVNAVNVYEKDGKKYAVYTLWNVAADYAVNDIVGQDGFFVPENSQTPDRFENKSTDEIYAMLDDEIEESDHDLPPQMQGKFCRTDSHEGEGEGQDQDGEGELSQQELEERAKEREEKWKGRMINAHENSDRKGDYPGQLKSIIDELVNPTLDWRSLLNQYISREIVRDVSFARPHKKSYSLGVYLPEVQRENLDVIVAIDTSGSISNDLLAIFLSEVQSIKDSHESVNMDIILADAAIQKIHSFKNNQRLNPSDIEMVGRGGTDHRPVFKWVEKNKQGSRILVCLTDGYTSFPDEQPNYDVIWATTPDGLGRSEYPFGKVVKVEEY